jgi:hypothetical protein
MALKDLGKNTPAVEIIRRVLSESNQPIRLEELTVNALHAWGRDFPNNPYDDLALVYKLATTVLRCKISFDELDGRVPLVHNEEHLEGPRALSNAMLAPDLNEVLDDLKNVKLSLPS